MIREDTVPTVSAVPLACQFGLNSVSALISMWMRGRQTHACRLQQLLLPINAL